ncbi:hypothetical protein LOZ07_000371 [Ophidiomyces ophidiicola]|uniref:Uncharacterized protein n=1 Tax=Ophidiomyces ophidiicola TaxID=1387563 RepID=A0ACB8UXD6_9EURO|nr:hypothetical protein LOZ62_006511 [Ophidiomyces ophidiicola]KAI1999726.1 hypothetical protein LOZ50_006542 [Ophidiomyces ophidiicola]KAI2056824.1 hypothetical protein LOZ44_001852 [Ophidiomyces ophidiicola]KAI2150617.1 hypothetical protein LOZ26_006495 [Ophidiomyces ophidiicola]KAI2173702.1 hypothetical protein LOZ24_004541 [Ophidiomyces ophidiicola]
MNESIGSPPPQSQFGSWLHTRSENFRGSQDPTLPTIEPHSFNNASGGYYWHSRADTAKAPPDREECLDASTSDLPPPVQPRDNITRENKGTAPVTSTRQLPIMQRIWSPLKIILTSSWINVLLVFVPVGIALGVLHRRQKANSSINPVVVFTINAVGIIPLAYLLGFATENVARKMGDKVGALLNVTFGNAVELIIFILALVAKEVRIVQASLLGSILANLLLILGMCFLFGGLRFREQLYNPAITQMSACLLSLSVMSLLLPTAFHASFSDLAAADKAVLQVSRGTSVLKSHAYIYESTPQHKIDEESHPGVLAEMLNSSGSSESSSTSGSDTDGSSGSHNTVKRIRKAIKKRRRRKSSTCSKVPQSPSLGLSLVRSRSSTSNVGSRLAQGASLVSTDYTAAIPCSSDDAEHELRPSFERYPGVATRDFETNGAPEGSGTRNQKHKKCLKTPRKSKRNKNTLLERNKEIQLTGNANPNVQFTDPTSVTELSEKRPFNLRPKPQGRLFSRMLPALQTRPISINELNQRPSLSRNVTQRVLRRTTSLPDRLNHLSNLSARPVPYIIPINPPNEVSNEDSELEENPHLSRIVSVILLVISTGLVAACAEFLVNSIDYLVKNTGISQAFIGLIIIPIVGNAAEHATAVAMASKNKMDLAIGVALGSSIQIALFVTPIIVLLGWCLRTEMSLYFSLFETVSLFASAFIANYLMLDGRTNYLEGALLIAAYVIISVGAFFFPSCRDLNSASNPPDPRVC